MPCYCHEIPLCQQDIQTIEDIQKKVASMQVENVTNVTLQKIGLSVASGGAVTPDNIGDLQDSINKMNDEIANNLSEMSTQCSQKLSLLESELSSMEISDAAYHADESEG